MWNHRAAKGVYGKSRGIQIYHFLKKPAAICPAIRRYSFESVSEGVFVRVTTSRAPFASLALIAALCAGFTLGLTAPASAGLDEGVAAAKRGDYATAISWLRPLAELGHARAQYNLGIMYYSGQGVPQVSAEALQWWRKAAELGHARAQYNLGIMYYSGQGVPQDSAEALQWWRKAAEQGYATAQYYLGVTYHTGLDVPQDYVQAHMRYNLAASRFPPGEDRDKAVKYRDIVAAKMTPAQIAEAQKLAREWKPK